MKTDKPAGTAIVPLTVRHKAILRKCAFASSLAILTGVLYLVFIGLAVVAPDVFRFLFNPQLLDAVVASLFPKRVALGHVLATLVALLITAWGFGYLWAWLCNRLTLVSGPGDQLTGGKITRRIGEEPLAKGFFWLLALVSLAASILLLRQQKPEWKVALGLLIWAGICLVLAIGGVALVRRIHRIGPGGIEIESWQELDRILSVPHPPLAQTELRWSDGPWAPTSFTRQQMWFYEKATSIIVHLQHRGVDLETISRENLYRYRQLILWVGAAAINKGNTWKAHEILKLLEPIERKSPKELFWLGASYFWVAVTEDDERKKREQLETASQLLHEASQLDDRNADLWWTLGWIYDELRLYKESVTANQKAVDVDARYAPWAYWTMAVSLLKDKEKGPDASIEALKGIGPGPWWNEIYKDPELAALKSDGRFATLYGTGRNYERGRNEKTN